MIQGNEVLASQNGNESKSEVRLDVNTNKLKEINMKLSTVEALQAEHKTIVYLSFNRDVNDKSTHVKKLARSIKVEGLHTPLHLVPATTALEEGIELLDEKGSIVTDGENKFVLVDGNNKFKAILLLRESKEPGKAIEPIKCIIDEDAKNIQKMVMTMNNVVKPWSDVDAIKAASKTKSNEIVEFIKDKVNDGFPFTTLSLILYGQKSKITKNMVMCYTAGTKDFLSCNLTIAKKKLEVMVETGFTNKFIKKRFLIEAINKAVHDGHSLDDVFAALKSFTNEEVKFAEDQRSLSLLESKIEEVERAKIN